MLSRWAHARRRRPSRERKRARARELGSDLPAGAADLGARGRHRHRDRRAPGGHRRGRDRLGQDDAAAEDRARDGPRPRARSSASRSLGASPRRASPRASRASSARRSARTSATRSASTTARRRSTYVKFMTDGILLAEIQGDRLLRRYDTLIIDEAHERSLTIDFLLGWLKRILPERPDLKVIVSSATLETERFSRVLRRRAGHPGRGPHVSRSTCSTSRPPTTSTLPTRSPTRSRT